MKIKKLDIQNFLTIGSAALELDDRGLLLIQGKNDDDPSAESNGAGKSSIVDALCWAIYGVTARGVSSDAVVNKTAKKNCSVSLVLEDGANAYRITRYRKDSTHKNQVIIHKIDGAGSTDISKGTDKETQEVINGVMGCSLDVFMAAVYAGQERMPDLPGMTDKILKTLIEEAAGVEVLTEAYANARERYTKAKLEVEALTARQASAINNVTDLNAELARLTLAAKDFEDGRRDRAKTEMAKIIPLKREIQAAEEALALWPADAEVEEKLAECKVKIDAQASEKAEMRRLNAELDAANKKRDLLRHQAAAARTQVMIMEKELANIEAKIGKPCGECGKPYAEHDMDAARSAQSAAITKLKSESRPIVTALRDAMEVAQLAAEKATEFEKRMTDMSAVATRQLQLSNLQNSIDAARRKIETRQKEIDGIKATAAAKLSEANPWTKAVESKEEEIKRNDAALADIAKAVEVAGSQLELLGDAVKVFGPAGVRAHVLDTVTPYLNERTQDYLGALADGNIHATWTTLTKSAKGELKEKFGIEVTNDKGAESFAGLSGGEKRKVRLATALALQDMVASRATKPVNIFVGDEIDDALDEAGLERLMTILERKAKERGTVLIISHNALTDWVDQVITVTKTGGYGVVSGDNLRGF